MTQHAKLSASGANKWLNCPGSVIMEADEPASESQYAIEGTVAHALGELKLRVALKEITKAKYQKEKLKLEEKYSFQIPCDMDEYTDGYRDFVMERYRHAITRDKQAEVMLEQRLDFSKYVPEGFGTGDAVIVSENAIEIIDLKYGKGVKVVAENNPQLMLYALGAIDEHNYLYDFQAVQMTIYQPRMDNIDVFTIFADELLDWGEHIKEPAEKAYKGSNECIPGIHCDSGFCRARAKCRAYNAKKIELAKSEFQMPSVLNNSEIAEILELAPKLKNWVTMVEAYALDKALKGEEFPGFKLVEGRSNRKYQDEQSVIKTLVNDNGFNIDTIAPRKLLTITNLEKEIGKSTFNELVSEYIIKPHGAPTLVGIDDKRPEWNSIANDFKEDIIKEK